MQYYAGRGLSDRHVHSKGKKCTRGGECPRDEIAALVKGQDGQLKRVLRVDWGRSEKTAGSSKLRKTRIALKSQLESHRWADGTPFILNQWILAFGAGLVKKWGFPKRKGKGQNTRSSNTAPQVREKGEKERKIKGSAGQSKISGRPHWGD